MTKGEPMKFRRKATSDPDEEAARAADDAALAAAEAQLNDGYLAGGLSGVRDILAIARRALREKREAEQRAARAEIAEARFARVLASAPCAREGCTYSRENHRMSNGGDHNPVRPEWLESAIAETALARANATTEGAQ